jgi:hypothetical protein
MYRGFAGERHGTDQQRAPAMTARVGRGGRDCNPSEPHRKQ